MGRAATKTRVSKPKPPALYDCDKCPAYCCSIYSIVSVTPEDLRRLAGHLELDLEQTRTRHTQITEGVRVLRRKRDPVLGHSCGFLDLETRRCSIYEGRPQVCRDYPGQPRCANYDVLEFERRVQENPGVLPLIQIRFPQRGTPT